MDVSKKINGVRYNLSQNRHNQIVIKKEKDIILVQNLDKKLDIDDAFNFLSNAAHGKYSDTGLKGNEEKLNTEEIKEENKIVIPKANPCLFCNSVPKVVYLRSAENAVTNLRALECTGAKCEGKRWIYTVDVVDSVEKADAKLITEWNKRMPLKEN